MIQCKKTGSQKGPVFLVHVLRALRQYRNVFKLIMTRFLMHVLRAWLQSVRRGKLKIFPDLFEHPLSIHFD